MTSTSEVHRWITSPVAWAVCQSKLRRMMWLYKLSLSFFTKPSEPFARLIRIPKMHSPRTAAASTTRRRPQGPVGVRPELLQGQQRLDHAGQVGLLGPQHRVYGDADNLGHQGVAGGVHVRQQDGPQEKAPAALQVPEDQRYFLPSGELSVCFHIFSFPK